MKRAKLSFAGLEIRFVDRDKALKQVEELVERGAHFVNDIHGSEGVGAGKAETYVKTLLNLIEYPPTSYERIVVLFTSIEGVSARSVALLSRSINKCVERV